MVQMSETVPTPEAIAELKKKVRKLNTKASQMKMDLHDIAEGLPEDLDKLPETAAQTYEIFCELDRLKKELKELEKQQ
jgi:hypothetical protein